MCKDGEHLFEPVEVESVMIHTVSEIMIMGTTVRKKYALCCLQCAYIGQFVGVVSEPDVIKSAPLGANNRGLAVDF